MKRASGKGVLGVIGGSGYRFAEGLHSVREELPAY